MDSFDFSLPQSLQMTLEKAGYLKPTPIQAECIPIIQKGQDLVGLAQTGTGKTGAYLIPLLSRLIEKKERRVLILTPTRELAQQIFHLSRQLSPERGPRAALVIGGEKFFFQEKALRFHPQIIIGTPGRLVDHLQRKTLVLKDVDHLVLDETDRLLDMGFEDQLKEIMLNLPRERQTLLFSATLPHSIKRMVHEYLENPKEISIGQPNRVADRVSQSISITQQKDQELLSALNEREGSVIVFVNSQRGVEKVAYHLRENQHRADALHGGMRQSKRERVLKSFRNKRFRILVATDVAARGLDIPHIAHVINYELPFCAEDYVHRIGRTARAEASGESLSLISPYEKQKWDNIERFLKGEKTKPQSFRKKPFRPRSFSSRRSDRSDYRGGSRSFRSRSSYSSAH